MLRDLQAEQKIADEIKIASEPWRMYLRDCASLLRTEGWCVVNFKDDRGHRCALGAMYEVSARYRHNSVVFNEAVDKFRAFIGVDKLHNGSVSVWNDEQKSADVVINAFEGAALS